jgi:GTPase KRas protein
LVVFAEEYSTLRDQWVREGQGFILVYSITERRSFERMETFRQALLRAKSRSPPLFILVGNKCDQTYERQVFKHEGESLGAVSHRDLLVRCSLT